MSDRPKYTLRNRFQYGAICHSKGVSCVWNPGEHPIEAEDSYDLYRKLGGEKAHDVFALIDLFNLLGQKGWELVSSTEAEDAEDYLFKRTYIMETPSA